MISIASDQRFSLPDSKIKRRGIRILVCVVMVFTGFILSAESRADSGYLKEDQDDSIPFDLEADTFQESAFEIPELSDESNWVEIEFPAVSNSIRFYIDVATLSLAADKVLRYFIILRNRSGKNTVYYEGLHCRRGRVKRYAYASAGNPLKKRESPRWQTIPGNTRNYHFVLSQGIFCDTGFGAKTVREVRQILSEERAIDANIYE